MWLIRLCIQQKENLQQAGQFDSSAGNKSPKETPTKTKKAGKESTKKKDENLKEEKKEAMVNMNSTPNNHKETSAKEIKDSVKEVQSSRRSKKKNDILAQIGNNINIKKKTLTFNYAVRF